MFLNTFIKYNTTVSIKILYSRIKIVGFLGILEYPLKFSSLNYNLNFCKYYYILPKSLFYFKNCIVISNLYFNVFFADLFKLLLGTSYG